MNNLNNITLLKNDYWYYRNGYLSIDLELFGRNLCELFNKYLGEYYCFRKFKPTIKTDKERSIWLQGEESKNLAIIRPISYDNIKKRDYNEVKEVNMSMHQQFVQAYTLYYKESPSAFSKFPLELDEKEFLLYFGKYDYGYVKVSLGDVENGKFIPSDFFNSNLIEDGIKFSNIMYPFVQEFIKEIFYYKVINEKPILTQNDMELILEKFEISKKQNICVLVDLLKNIQEESTKILLGSSSAYNILKLKK